MLSDIMDVAVDVKAQTKLAPDPVSMPSVPTPHTAHSCERSRSPWRQVEEELSASLRFTSRTSSVFVIQRLGAGDAEGGQRAAVVHRE